jgi:predicted ATP-dependent serine protease
MLSCCHCGFWSELAAEVCPACLAYSPFVAAATSDGPTASAVLVSEITSRPARIVRTGFAAWDEALQGGVALPSLMVLYGEPGARKSTWAAALADRFAKALRGTALYLSAEMTRDDVREVSRRHGKAERLYVFGKENGAESLDACKREITQLQPHVVVFDSVQSFDAGREIAGHPLAAALTLHAARSLARRQRIVILISQVNAQGQPAGPRRLLHDCDTIVRVTPESVTVDKHRSGRGPHPRSATLSP